MSPTNPTSLGVSPARPLFILAFDHRYVLRQLFGTDGVLQDDTMRQMKVLAVDALLSVAEPVRATTGGVAGLLMDAETGGAQLARARAHGIVLSTPIERSGAATFTLDHGDAFLAELSRVGPDHAKVLVFLNPDAEPEYTEQIRRASEALGQAAAAGWATMVEFVVPPTPAQLAGVGNDEHEFDLHIRPSLVCRTIEDFYRAGVRPELWKLEGLESSQDYLAVASAIRAHDPLAQTIVLGRGADDARVDRWLTLAAGTHAFSGFAIGRSIWYEPLRAWLSKDSDDAETVQGIAANYARFAGVYASASANAASPQVDA